MAHSVFDPRRGTWSIRWNNGTKIESETVTSHPPKGWRPGDPKPKEPPAVVEAKAAKLKIEKTLRTSRRSGKSIASVRAFLDARLKFCQSRGAIGSEQVMRDAFDAFAGWCERKRIVAVPQVTSAVCAKWIEARSKEVSRQTKKPRSYRGMLRDKMLIQAAWAQAVKLGELDTNPWTAVEIPGKPNESKRESWSPEQLKRLVDCSPGWLKTLLIVGCNTGLRIAALVRLEWRDVEFSKPGEPGRGLIRVRKELDKAGKGYSVPMSEACFDALNAIRQTRNPDVPWVITGRSGGKINHHSISADAIVRNAAKAGLPKPASPNHHMRRTFGRQAVLGQLTGRPIPVFVVSRWLGHASIKMTEYYLDIEIDASHEWMAQAGDSQAPSGQVPDATNSSQ